MKRTTSVSAEPIVREPKVDVYQIYRFILAAMLEAGRNRIFALSDMIIYFKINADDMPRFICEMNK